MKENFTNWTSKNEKIDNFIQEMQLKIDSPFNTIFEWIPYNKFNNINEINEGSSTVVYSAIWKDSSLCWNMDNRKCIRKLVDKVTLVCLIYSIDMFLNKVWNLFYKFNLSTF